MDALLHDFIHGALFCFRAAIPKISRNAECIISETGAADVLEAAST